MWWAYEEACSLFNNLICLLRRASATCTPAPTQIAVANNFSAGTQRPHAYVDTDVEHLI